jgi:DNA-binding LacI/PurR family transcriptional regulator
MPRHELGVAAMEGILAALETRATRIQPRQLPFEIVVRASSAPPPDANEALVA